MSRTSGEIVYRELSYKIIGLAMQVHRELGFGFLEKVYENVMLVILRREAINAIQQAPITVRFLGEVVGVLELKTVEKITDAHKAQALNYLKATGMKLAIILNFGKESLEYERLAY